MTLNSMTIEYYKCNSLKPYAGNLRSHNRAQRRKLLSSLRRFGLPTPVLIEADGTILDGHLVVELWVELGNDDIPVIVIRNRDPAELRALRLALNRSPLDSRWNEPALRAEFEYLQQADFDMSVISFDQVEIDMVLSINDSPSGEVEEAPAAPCPSSPPVTVVGDVWQLGRHRLICGDCRGEEVIRRLMAGERATMCFTDPPYNVSISSVVGLGKAKHPEFAMASGEMSREEFTEFLVGFMGRATEALSDGALLYVCMDWRHQPELLNAAEQLGLTQLNLCVWTKSNPGMGSFYRSAHELVHIFKIGAAPHRNNFELGQKGRSRSNVWAYRGMNVPGKERDELLKIHPTCKPVALVADAILDVTATNEIVLDPFMGSGTTLIAAERTGRTCYGVEYEPRYVDAAVRRWQDYSGGKAVLCGTSHSFEEVQAARCQPPQLLLAPPAGGAPDGGQV